MENESLQNEAAPKQDLIKKPRNASFELLRILSMIFIIAHHFYLHGGWYNAPNPVNSVLLRIVQTLFLPSVNLFVLISAYFMSAKTEMKFDWKKLLRLWVPVSFYSVVIFIVFVALGYAEPTVMAIHQVVFPVSFGNYWFFSAYFLMFLLSPLLNLIVQRLNFKQFSILVGIIIVVATLQEPGAFGTLPLYNGYNGIWFCMLYFIGAYIRKFDIRLKGKLQILAIAVYVVLVVISYFVGRDTFGRYGAQYTSLNTILMSIPILLSFKNLKIEKQWLSRIICGISSVTFGVYLIHDNPLMRSFMYERIFHSSKFIPSDFAFLIFWGFVLATFVVCAVIECIRLNVFKLFEKLIQKLIVSIKEKRANDVSLR